MTLVIEIRVVGLTIRPVGFRDVGDLVIGVTFGGMSRIRRAELWATKRRVLMPGEGPVSGRPPGSRVRAEGSVGASFPFPLAPAEVAYLNGHRPFSLVGGGNGSKCPLYGHRFFVMCARSDPLAKTSALPEARPVRRWGQ